MTTQLGIYNGALRILKERKLASLSENREPRRLLDDVWGDGQTEGAVKFCLEMAHWTFATRTVQIDYSPSVEPPFGYRYAFDQPSDMVRVNGIWTDPHCTQPLLRYADERHYWFCDQSVIYVSYVSNADEYGADLSLWPESFVKVVEAYLAKEIAGSLTQGENRIERANAEWAEAKKLAASIDAMNKPTSFPPPGTWSRSRQGGWHRNSRWEVRG